MEDYNEIESAKLSKINSGGLINVRLNKLWNLCYSASILGKYSLWNCILDCIWSELGGEYKTDDTEQKDFDSINLKLKQLNNWDNKNTGFCKISDDDRREMTRQYQLLRAKELYLRRIMNQQGKGTAYSDEDGDMM